MKVMFNCKIDENTFSAIVDAQSIIYLNKRITIDTVDDTYISTKEMTIEDYIKIVTDSSNVHLIDFYYKYSNVLFKIDNY